LQKKIGRKEIGSEKHCWLRNDNGFLTKSSEKMTKCI